MPEPDISKDAVGLTPDEPTSSHRGHVATNQTEVVTSPRSDDERQVDLAKNLPGQSVRVQAIAEQRAQPVVTWLARVFGVHTNERAWRMGEKGEELVAKELAQLPEGWHILHSIEVGKKGSDIDHLVIGRAGVYSLNTKHHRDASIWVAGNTFLVNGQRQPYLRNSRHDADSEPFRTPVPIESVHRFRRFRTPGEELAPGAGVS